MPLITFYPSLSRFIARKVGFIGGIRRYADHARANTPPSSSPSLKDRMKNPSRGGRNLRDRYLVLERSLRGKEALARSRDNQQEISTSNTLSVLSPGSSKIPTFRGFLIPIEPSPPESDECCMSGCAVCVYDLYEESLEAYKESVQSLQTSLTLMSIPENEWPKHIQTKSASNQDNPPKAGSVVMSAFEELERRLKEKAVGQKAINTPSVLLNESVRLSHTYHRPPESKPPFHWKDVLDGLRCLLFGNR